jgi:hypothetical protein
MAEKPSERKMVMEMDEKNAKWRTAPSALPTN